MNVRKAISAVLIPAMGAVTAAASPIETKFSYQGRLTQSGEAVSDTADFEFALWDADVDGNMIGDVVALDDVLIEDGLFTVELDFGEAAFVGDSRWLEIAVRSPAGEGELTLLAPRQPLTAAPYALYALNSANDSPWEASGDDISYEAGRVGIGTDAPTDLLTVFGGSLTLRTPDNARDQDLRFQNSGGFYSWRMYRAERGGGPPDLRFAGGGAADPEALPDHLTISNEGDVTLGGTDVGDKNGFARVLNVRGTVNSAVKFSGSGISDQWWLGMCSDGNICVFHDGPAAGIFSVPILRIRGGGDIAEPFNVREVPIASTADAAEGAPVVTSLIKPGMVVAIDPDAIGELRIADTAYDPTVAGIISGAGGINAGMVLGQEGTIVDGKHPVALTGRVWAWCDADAGGPIQPGDMLTTSHTPGHAMKAADRARAGGATIGKAMSKLETGKGLVLVLVSLQ